MMRHTRPEAKRNSRCTMWCVQMAPNIHIESWWLQWKRGIASEFRQASRYMPESGRKFEEEQRGDGKDLRSMHMYFGDDLIWFLCYIWLGKFVIMSGLVSAKYRATRLWTSTNVAVIALDVTVTITKQTSQEPPMTQMPALYYKRLLRGSRPF